MGGPNLEIGRMALYIFFPVTVFYYFNLPSFYTNNVKGKLVRHIISKSILEQPNSCSEFFPPSTHRTFIVQRL